MGRGRFFLGNMAERTVLLISKDTAYAEFLKKNLGPSGYAFELREALPANLRRPGYETHPLMIDLGMPRSVEILSSFRAYHPEASIIAVSNGNFRKMEEALRAGATYAVFERNGGDPGTLKETLRHIYEGFSARQELETLRALTEPKIVAKSAAMRTAMKLADDAATLPFPNADKPVVLFGPPGSGRELVARHVHSKSHRSGMPFVSMTGGDGLADSIMAARGGTLFIKIKDLKALGEEAADAVKHLIAQKELFYSADGSAPARVDVRVMLGCFCPEDAQLLQGMDYMGIEVPPIEQRKEDIVPLANHFLEELSAFLKTGKKYFTKSARETLAEREYPEGVGGLKKLVHRAFFLGTANAIGDKDLLGSEFLGKCSFKEFLDERLRLYLRKMAQLERSNLYDTVISEVEKALIELALGEMGGNKLRAAKALGMNRNTFRAKLKNLKIGGYAKRPAATGKEPADSRLRGNDGQKKHA